jgi:SAM-dependent methyltransferase
MKLYTSLAHIYHAMYQGLFDYDDEFQFYDRTLSMGPARSVIEFGCGSGNLAKRFIDNGYLYHGVDLNREMLDIAASYLPKEKFSQGDMRHYKSDKKFDACLITGRSISYLVSDEDVKMAFDTMHDCLNSNGLLIFDAIDAEKLFEDFDTSEKVLTVGNYKRESRSVPNQTGRPWTWDWSSEYYSFDGNNYTLAGDDFATVRAFTKYELSNFLSQSGFEILNIATKNTYIWEDNFFIARKHNQVF